MPGLTTSRPQVVQLLFDDLLAGADHQIEQDAEFRQAAPAASRIEARCRIRALLIDHHAAMLALDRDRVAAIREEVRELVEAENGNRRFGSMIPKHGVGWILDRATAAAPGAVPLWGQTGSFEVTAAGGRFTVRLEGLVVSTPRGSWWPSFDAYARNPSDKRLGPVGFRIFRHDVRVEPAPRLLPDQVAIAAIEAAVTRGAEGRP